MTYLCVPILVEDVDAALRDAALARDAGASLVEYRVDHVFHGTGEGGSFDDFGLAQVKRLCNESPLPCIVTCRSASEGGGYDGDDMARVSLYEALGTMSAPEHPPRYIDVELATYTRSANLRQKVDLAVDHPGQRRDLSTALILSAHDFQGRPANLSRTLAAMGAEPAAAVHKVAFRARSLRDNLEIFEILAHASRPTIALGMGEFGLLSRVLAPKFGAFLTFASLRDQSATAPGQPTIDQLRRLYRFDSIGPRTSVYGVIGWPVGHSMSPLVHNAGFAALGHDGVYLPLPVPAEWEHFKATLLALLDDPRLDFRGASVTLPHKEHLVRLAREDSARRWRIDASAERCGAANTLVVGPDGACTISNTDAPAAVAPLREAVGDLTGKRAAVIGAGGVARAVAAGLLEAGATVVVYNRSRERAEALVGDMSQAFPAGRCVVGPWDAMGRCCCEILVNATPVGMRGGPDPAASPVPESVIASCAKSGVVMDTVYNPVRTPLAAACEEKGVRFIDGRRMFVEQALLQADVWVPNVEAPARLRDLYAGLVGKALESRVAGG